MTLNQTSKLVSFLETLELKLDNWNPGQVELDVETFENTVTVTFNKHSELSESAFWQMVGIFNDVRFDSDTMSFTVKF